MLSANSDVSTNADITRSTRNVPRIEITPISSGIAAATTPRNTSSSRIASSGNAISSALVRSSRVWSLTSLKLGREAAHRHVERARRRARLPWRPRPPRRPRPRRPASTGGRRSPASGRRARSARADRRGCSSGLTTRPTCLVSASARLEPGDLAPHRRAARRSSRPPSAVAHDEDDARVRVVAERLAQQLGRALALRGAVGEAGRLEVVLDVVPDARRRAPRTRRRAPARASAAATSGRRSASSTGRGPYQSEFLQGTHSLYGQRHAAHVLRGEGLLDRPHARRRRRVVDAADRARPRRSASPASTRSSATSGSRARCSPSGSATLRRARRASSATPYQDNPLRYDYRLTEKGADLAMVLLAMQSWGDRWLLGDAAPPVLMRHDPCGAITAAGGGVLGVRRAAAAGGPDAATERRRGAASAAVRPRGAAGAAGRGRCA